MAKLAAILVSLILLAVWGWLAWGEYVRYIESVPPIETALVDGNPLEEVEVTLRPRPSFAGAFMFCTGTQGSDLEEYRLPTEPKEVADLRIALGAVLAVSFALVYVAFIGAGAIFSAGLTAFIAALTAFGYAFLAVTLLTRIAWAMFGATEPLQYDAVIAGVSLFAALMLLTSIVVLIRLRSVVRGEHSAMVATVKALLVLALTSVAFAPVGVPPEFVYNGIHGLYWLAGACLLTLSVIGLTQSNYRYD